MRAGHGLTDEDRQGWLAKLQEECSKRYAEGSEYLAISASALKLQYRDKLREVSQTSPGLRVRFIFLDAPEEVLRERAIKRHGHYAGGNLVHSQFEALEEPTKRETDVMRVDATLEIEELSRDVEKTVKDAMRSAAQCDDA